MALIQSLLTIFVIILFGFFCHKRKMLNQMQIEGFEIFLFKVALPAYLFVSTLSHDIAILINTQYIISYLFTFILLMILVIMLFSKATTLPKLCLKILASGYVNAAIYTLPIITFLLGDPTAGILGNLIQVIIIQPFFIVILNFIYHHEKSIFKKLLNIISTPLIIMPILGLACNYWHIYPPQIIIDVAQNIGNSAPSLALFTFGLTLSGMYISKQDVDRKLVILVLLKNIGHPFIAFIVGYYLFNLSQYWLYSLIIAASAPTAFLIYLIAKQFSIEQDLVKRVVAISSILSLFSLIVIAMVLG